MRGSRSDSILAASCGRGWREAPDKGRRDGGELAEGSPSHAWPYCTRGSFKLKDRVDAHPPPAAIASRSSLTSNAPRVPLGHANNKGLCARHRTWRGAAHRRPRSRVAHDPREIMPERIGGE